MKYTYLFDAKYRIDDKQDQERYDVPPENAINQMHRYRDAIYYTEKGQDRAHLKKEIIAGYVLFPGRIPLEAMDEESGEYYYQKSNRLIGIAMTRKEFKTFLTHFPSSIGQNFSINTVRP